jgi:uncharacterized protein
MNIFFNISHPAHVHLFKYAIRGLQKKGHNIFVGARNKEFCTQLLDAYHIPHRVLTSKGLGLTGLIRELMIQQVRIARIIQKNAIDMMIQMNGIFNAPVGRIYGIPTLAFSDTENDHIANFISFNLTRHVFTPTCFENMTRGRFRNLIYYPGYHELAYLSPKHFPHPVKPENKFLVRFVGWAAGHDIGEKSLSKKQKIEIVHRLNHYGKVYISSESPLPDEIKPYEFKIHPSRIHEFMATCKMIVGESATMASEAACLGIPALFISNTGRGYTTEQDKKYGLIRHFRLDQWDETIQTLEYWAQTDLFSDWQRKRRAMLSDKMEVSDWLVDLIHDYPESITAAHRGLFERYAL